MMLDESGLQIKHGEQTNVHEYYDRSIQGVDLAVLLKFIQNLVPYLRLFLHRRQGRLFVTSCGVLESFPPKGQEFA